MADSNDGRSGLSALRALGALAVLAALVALSLASLRPPDPVPATAAATEFSSARAMKHLAVIAARPHRMGSPAHDDVRAYIVKELAALGLEPKVQETSVAQLRFTERWGWPARVATVKNVVARMKGTEGGRAVMLMAHYDTRSMTPGAGDDGAGVAALLETARALGAGPKPRRDVLFLVTDGEELGLLGAKAFIEEHPAAHDAAVVLNFDARGDRGPALMFQTSDRAEHLIAELARVTPRPVANSLAQAIYKRMPNDSDLTEFLPTGVDAMNFGYIGGLERYHAPSDTVANMDEGTLQHVGSYMLPLARRLADLPLPLARGGEATYFNAGPFLLRYPARADVAVAVAVDVLLALVVALGLRKKRVRLSLVLASVGVTLGTVLLAALAAHGAWAFASSRHADYAIVAAASATLKERWGIGFAVIGIAAVVGVHAAIAGRVTALERGLGAAIVFGFVAVPVATALPGGGWWVAWPLAGALLPWALVIARAGDADDDATSWAAFTLRLVACVAPIVLLAPLVATLYAAFGPDAALAIAGLVALTTALVAPAVGDVIAPDRRVAPLVAVAAAFVLLVAARSTPAFDRASPRPDTLYFATDLDMRRAWWVSPDAPLDPWTSKVLAGAPRGALPGHMSAYGTADLTSREVPFVDLEGARAEIVTDGRAAAKMLDLRIVAPPLTEVVVVRIWAGVAAARVQGRVVPAKNGALLFYYSAPPATGFALSLELVAAAPVAVRLATQRAGFPRALADALGPRPDGLAPKPGMLPPWDEMQESDMTVTTREIEIQ